MPTANGSVDILAKKVVWAYWPMSFKDLRTIAWKNYIFLSLDLIEMFSWSLIILAHITQKSQVLVWEGNGLII